MWDRNVTDINGITFGGEDEEISQTANEIGQILLNKQYICKAVAKVKEVKVDTDLELSDFVASEATLGDTINILDNVQFYNQSKGVSAEIISVLKMEGDKAESCVSEIYNNLQKLLAAVESLKEYK